MILAQIEDLILIIKKQDAGSEDISKIEDCVMSYADYHNEAVKQGKTIAMSYEQMSDAKFADLIARLHEKRKELHKNMIRKTSVLNKICEKYGVPVIYDGCMDIEKGRDDDNTRYGVAEFCEKLCSEMFKVTHQIKVSTKAKEAFSEYLTKVSPDKSIVQNMISRATAEKEMEEGKFETEEEYDR